jgi:NAD+ synthase
MCNTTQKRLFGVELLNLDCQQEADRIGASLREIVSRRLRKKGVVVPMSGGIDSSVVTALSVHSLGKEKVFGLLMPERDSSSETLGLSHGLAEHLGIQDAHEDISPIATPPRCWWKRFTANLESQEAEDHQPEALSLG